MSGPLRVKLDILEQAIGKESFAKKSKFPPDLKPLLIDAALTAMDQEEYDDNFFNIMPNIFPYNRFTMLVSARGVFLTCAALIPLLRRNSSNAKSAHRACKG